VTNPRYRTRVDGPPDDCAAGGRCRVARVLRPIVQRLSVVIPAVIFVSCGGGSGDRGAMSMSIPRGTLLQTPPDLVSTIPAGTLLAELRASSNQQLLTLGGIPVCDIAIYHIEYETVGGRNEPATASAALMVPVGVDPRCRNERPILLYAHGTTIEHAFNLADLHDPANAEGLLLATFFASQGYIVVAPNFAGYDTSDLPYHPYLVADQQSRDMIDGLTAARTALPLASALLVRDSGRLFITGYSQGGFVAMATQRAMQALGQPVTACAPMSGPYALAAFVDALYYGQVSGDATVVSAFLTTAFQRTYSNVYAAPGDVFEAQYATGIDSLLPTTTPRSQLYAEGKLPQYALFSAEPPAPAYANITPPAMPAILAPVFARGFGANNLITNSFRLRYLEDAAQNPDGGFPAVTTGVVGSSANLPLRQALARNDLRDWTPVAPVLLCGGDQDPTVFWLNTTLMQGYWASQALSPALVTVVDLEASGGAGTYASLHTAFIVAKDLVAANAIAQGATDGGAAAVADAYHTTLIAPFCLAAVVSFFSKQ
jgi:prolyl oligopeptidase family protein